jgi:eukaryotic-like serine/threonine-protein kinase
MIGKTLGHFRVGENLGRGGMGEVYAADDLNLNRKVALKFLPDAFAGDPERMARFEREARLLASLNHPNIAAIYGLEQAEGKRFIVMELVEGETLAQRIGKGALPVEEALALCRQMADGLEAAHEKGVIHRDLKPANVMITDGDKVKILDFGLAKALSDEAQTIDPSQSPTLTEAMTRPGVILGTAAYMSPEQAKGKSVDKRADIWSFGCILYECLTGKRAFEGETATETLSAVLKSEPDWQALPASTPANIRIILRRCLQKDLARRYRDASVTRIEIEDALIYPQPPESTVPTKSGWRRAPRLGLVAMGFLALGGIAAWILKPSTPPSAQAPSRLQINLPPGDQFDRREIPPIALSPDGRYLVYSAIHNGVQQLFVRPINSYDVRPIPGTEGASYPFFSPDGAWIGFLSVGKIRKVSIAGGMATTICEYAGVGGAAWGSDDTIVFSPSSTDGLFRVPATGGKPYALTTLDRANGESSHRWPQFMPSGKSLLFTIRTGQGWDEYHVAALRLDTGEKRVVLRGGNMGRFVHTGHLLYYREGKILALPFDPARLEITGNAPQTVLEAVAETSYTVGAAYSLSSTGSLAYIPAGLRQLDRRLVWVDRKGKIEPIPAPARPFHYADLGPSLSPDGRQIAAHTESGIAEIGIYDIGRGIWTRLTADAGASSLFPIWAPDGKRITYMGYRAGLINLYLKNADGTGAEEQLTTGENLKYPSSWSTDGKWLCFSERTRNSYDIGILEIGGERRQTLLLSGRFNESMGQFSPDGRWLAYTSNESGRSEVYVRPFRRPGTQIQVSTEGGGKSCWARSGRELFYVNGNKVMAVDIKTEPLFAAGKPRLLFEGQFGGLDVAPDGRFLMVQPVEPEQPATTINVVLNWFEELKQRMQTK